MGPGTSTTEDTRKEILALLERLHRHKDAAYGDAWRKRGEVIAIFANMARKYDRLLIAFNEQRPAATERLGDTAADLCVYTGKYLTWIADRQPREFAQARIGLDATEVSAARGPDALGAVFDALAHDSSVPRPTNAHEAWSRVRRSFEQLEQPLMAQATPGASPEALMDYTDKADLAWRLAAELLWLLVFLDAEAPETLTNMRSEVAQMDRAAQG